MKTIEIFEEENSINIDDEDSSAGVKFLPEIKKFQVSSNSKENYLFSNQTCQYKISTNPTEVYIKLLESSTEPPLVYSVKDGVVLKSDIIKKDKESLGENYYEEGTLESIANWEKQVEWNKIELSSWPEVIFFILLKHPEIIPYEEYRRILRQTEEKIKNGLLKIREVLQKTDKTGLQILKGSLGDRIWYPENEEVSEEKRKLAVNYLKKEIIDPLFNKNSKEYSGITQEEFRSSSEILECVDIFLNKNIPISKNKNESAEKKNNSKMKWFIVIALSIIALSWGIWTAIGVFILGTIIISVLSK